MDVDDILRKTEYWLPRRELINSIGLDYVPWMNMPTIIDGIKRSDPNVHFHYVTTTPQTVGPMRHEDHLTSEPNVICMIGRPEIRRVRRQLLPSRELRLPSDRSCNVAPNIQEPNEQHDPSHRVFP